MEEHAVKILKIESVTHDVKHFVFEKPKGYKFGPGQATEVAINKPGWKDQKRPFTFTGLNSANALEFTIKIYAAHGGVTNELGKLKPGDELLIHDVWGAIAYKGPGVFIAGGAGITPFIAILRQLYKENQLAGNKLIFSNKTAADIILKEEFEKMLGNNFINVLTREKPGNYHEGRIDQTFLKSAVHNFNQHFYVCGPEQFVENIQKMLVDSGAKVDAVVIEK